MGRTLPSITNAFLDEQQSLAPFRRALPLTDQRALDDLFGASRHHLAAAAYASHLLPFEIMLLSMLVEEHKLVLHLPVELERLHLLLGLDPLPDGMPRLASATSAGETMGPALPEGHPALHDETPSPYAPPPADPAVQDLPSGIPLRKRKWWAGGGREGGGGPPAAGRAPRG